MPSRTVNVPAAVAFHGAWREALPPGGRSNTSERGVATTTPCASRTVTETGNLPESRVPALRTVSDRATSLPCVGVVEEAVNASMTTDVRGTMGTASAAELLSFRVSAKAFCGSTTRTTGTSIAPDATCTWKLTGKTELADRSTEVDAAALPCTDTDTVTPATPCRPRFPTWPEMLSVVGNPATTAGVETSEPATAKRSTPSGRSLMTRGNATRSSSDLVSSSAPSAFTTKDACVDPAWPVVSSGKRTVVVAIASTATTVPP